MNIAEDPRRPALQAYIRTLADGMRLQAWDIEVAEGEPEDDSAVLSTDPDPRRHWAPIHVRVRATDHCDTAFWDERPEEQRHDLVHELTHIVLTPLWLWVHDGSWRHQLTRREFDLVEEVFREQLEASTDFLARLIAPTLPLPPSTWLLESVAATPQARPPRAIDTSGGSQLP